MSVISRNQLKLYSLFADLSDKDLDRIADIVDREDVVANTIIIQEGDTGEVLYLLSEGVVDIHKTLTIVTSKHEFGSRERSFTRLTGEHHCYFGEMALFGKGQRSATVKAVTACKLFVINKDRFHDLSDRDPRIGYTVVSNIARTLSDYLRQTNDDVIKLTTALSLALSGGK
jgi:CRP/FNR family transcriptional regulator, cyclic AMP receptor protein